jgi:hypothetical protein
MELGCISALDSRGRTIWIADAHRGDGKRFVVHADEKLSASLNLRGSRTNWRCQRFLVMTVIEIKLHSCAGSETFRILGRFSASALAARAYLANQVEQFGRFPAGRSRTCHLAAFLAGLPSTGQEIDDKLPSNSS